MAGAKALLGAAGSVGMASMVVPVAEVGAVEFGAGASVGVLAAKFGLSNAKRAKGISEISSLSIRKRILENSAANREVIDAIENSRFSIYSAKESQIMHGYQADDWSMAVLKRGDIVYGGLPGRSAYYTDLEALLSAQGDRQALGRGLQIKPHPLRGYRSSVGEYELIQDVRVPSGIARANYILGPGESQQFYINNHSSILRSSGQGDGCNFINSLIKIKSPLITHITH